MSDKPTVCLIGPLVSYDDEVKNWRTHFAGQWDDTFDFTTPYDCHECISDDVKFVKEYTDIPDYDPAGGVARFSGESVVYNDVEYVIAESIIQSDAQVIDRSDAVLIGWGARPSVRVPMVMKYVHMMNTVGVLVDSFVSEFGQDSSTFAIGTRAGQETLTMFENATRYWREWKPLVVWFEPSGSRHKLEDINLSPWLIHHPDYISISARDCTEYLASYFGVSLWDN